MAAPRLVSGLTTITSPSSLSQNWQFPALDPDDSTNKSVAWSAFTQRPVITDNDGATLTTEQLGSVVFCGNTGAVSFILPAAASSAGGIFTFVKTSADAQIITLDGNASETINGATTNTSMDAQYDTITIACNGTAWFIIAQSIA